MTALKRVHRVLPAGQAATDVAFDRWAHGEGWSAGLVDGRRDGFADGYAVGFNAGSRNPLTGATYPWIVRSTGVVNHFYFYCLDAEFGPFSLKFCFLLPLQRPAVCLNGNERAKRVAAAGRIDFAALDNGFAACPDPDRLQRICHGVTPAAVDRLLRSG